MAGARPGDVAVDGDGPGGEGPRRGSANRLPVTPERRTAVAFVVAVAGLGLGSWLAAGLFVSHVLITKNLYGEPLGTSEVEVQRFPWEAAACLVLLVAGTAAAFVARSAGAALVGIGLLAVGVGVVLAAGSQLGIWQVELPEPAVERARDHPICRSGGDSSDCPGG